MPSPLGAAVPRDWAGRGWARLGWAPLGFALVSLACQPAADCGGFCGAGTHCQAEGPGLPQACVADTPTDADEPAAVEPEAKGKRRRKGRRGGKRGADDGADAAQDDGPAVAATIVDDSRVPKYDPNRTQTIGMGDGTERLTDFAVKNHMKKLEPKFNRCIEQAALATDLALHGAVDFTIGVEPTGKVWGVTVRAPAAMKQTGVVACVRVAVYGSRFPTWDGPSMGVDYSFDVG